MTSPGMLESPFPERAASLHTPGAHSPHSPGSPRPTKLPHVPAAPEPPAAGQLTSLRQRSSSTPVHDRRRCNPVSPSLPSAVCSRFRFRMELRLFLPFPGPLAQSHPGPGPRNFGVSTHCALPTLQRPGPCTYVGLLAGKGVSLE